MFGHSRAQTSDTHETVHTAPLRSKDVVVLEDKPDASLPLLVEGMEPRKNSVRERIRATACSTPRRKCASCCLCCLFFTGAVVLPITLLVVAPAIVQVPS